MRITINLISDTEINLPLSYNHAVQGFIYNNIRNENLKTFVHDIGFEYNKRKFKMFSFSRIEGEYFIDKKNMRIKYKSPITIKITSIYNDFIQDLANTLLEKEEVIIGKNNLRIESVKIETPSIDNKMLVRTISPIVVYSTLQNEIKKFTYYYNPGEEGFEKMITNNLNRKASTLLGHTVKKDITIKTLKYRKKPNKIKYKDTIIHGYSGIFLLEGDIDLMNIAYNYGLGSKNSQGFGMVEICEEDILND
jgi:CRISPR-associated endoribonuclease Cas6